MTIHYPGPFGLRMFYTTIVSNITIEHKAEYNIELVETSPEPGTIFNDLDIVLRDTTSAQLNTYCDAWSDLVKVILNNAAGNSINRYELWKYEPNTYDASFVSTYEAVDAGTSASAMQIAGQSILTYRTIGGGIMKLNFMETVVQQGATDPPPYTNAGLVAINSFILGTTNGFKARDNTFPFAAIAHYPGVSEALFKRRYR